MRTLPLFSRSRLGSKAVIAVGVLLALVAASTVAYHWILQRPPSCAGHFDLAITGGEIIDGLGGPPLRADLGIREKRIVCIGNINPTQATRVIDASQLTIAPGFIDVHTHVERNMPARGEPFLAANFVRQGVTTIITGNCGRSVLDLGKAFSQLEANGVQINIASLIGHNTIRQHVMRNGDGTPTFEQLAKMKSLVAAGMRDGALGLSTGLEYIPGAFAKPDEIAALAKLVRDDGGIYVSHIRNEGAQGIAAVREAIEIGNRTGVHVHISHFKAEGPAQWGSATARLDLIREANNKGLTVSLDQYPYAASSTTIAVLLPPWVSSDGAGGLRNRLNDPSTRARVRAQMLEQLKLSGWNDYSFARVSYCGFDRSLVGQTIPQIAHRHELTNLRPHDAAAQVHANFHPTTTEIDRDLERQADTIIDLFSHGDTQMVFFNMDEADVETIMRNPGVMFGSDSGVRDENGIALPHPRGFGTFPRVLGLYARDKQLFSMEEAVERMTSLPAKTFGLIERGQIKEGYYADVVLFDRNRVIDRATYERPLNAPQGIYYVVVNGVLVLDRETLMKTQPGMVLRRSEK
jgi:N-acyl-D-amino-acid deacylase